MARTIVKFIIALHFVHFIFALFYLGMPPPMLPG